MAALTIAQKLTIAEINEYLITGAIIKGNTSIDAELPIKIRNLRKSISYRYNNNPSDTTLPATSNYMLGMCLYIQLAQGMVLTPGSIAAIASNATSPAPLDWKVSGTASALAPLATGDSSCTLTQFIGYKNLNFYRGGQPQYTTDPGDGTTYYSWSSATGVFQLFNGDANLDELMRISL